MMEDLSLHILDIVENSIAAKARRVSVRVEERPSRDRRIMEIVDDGRGMGAKLKAKALDPFVTTKKARRIGLGLPFLAQAAEAAGGGLKVASVPGRGTRVRATFRLGHIDLQPLGDVGETFAVLIAGHPDVQFRYTHVTDAGRYVFHSRDVFARTGAATPLTPGTLSGIRKEINGGIARLRGGSPRRPK